MRWKYIFICLIVHLTYLKAYLGNERRPFIKNIILKRRSPIVSGIPYSTYDLPAAENLHPGHTLIRPNPKSLKSSVKFPHEDEGNAVYGNLGNLGITYDKTNQRLLYSGFRKSTQRLLENTILQAIKNIYRANTNGRKDVIVLELSPYSIKSNSRQSRPETISEEENNANENIWSNENMGTRRAADRDRRLQFRDRTKFYYSSGSVPSEEIFNSSLSSETSSDFEDNPGNPFTVHREKYLQNFLWNHFMDGDHMNIDPMAPNVQTAGPSGPNLFFVRKWWYFNQDDYKPLR